MPYKLCCHSLFTKPNISAIIELMDDRLISQIEELGLSNKEARVYVANLTLGPAGVQQIADTSGIKRVTTYVILESLVSLGLASQTTKAKKTLFNAESPENLQRLLDKKEQSVREQKQQLKELLPDLAKLTRSHAEAPVVKFYDGADSIQTITREFAEKIKGSEIQQIYGISNLDRLNKYFPDIVTNQANPERISAGVRSLFLYTCSEGPVLKLSDEVKNRLSMFVPTKDFNFTSDISIAGDYVALLALEGSKPSGITIRSQSIADGMRAVFDLAWKSASQYPENKSQN